MKKFFSSIGRFLKNNYWLQPLLLVVVVFVLVFSLQGFDSVIESIRNWISPNSKCSACSSMKYEKAKDKIASVGDDEALYLLVYEDDCDACKNIYRNLNTYIKANDLDVYAVNIGIKEETTYTEQVTYYDATLAKDEDGNGYDELAELTEAVRLYIAEYTDASITKTAYTYTLGKPTLIRFVKGESGAKIQGVLTDTDKFTSEYLKEFTNSKTYE